MKRAPRTAAAKSVHEAPRRTRRSRELARRQILEAAEELLVLGGVHAVTVRAVAERVALTDMGVNHHFKTRELLLETLLNGIAARLRAQLAQLAQQWLEVETGLSTLVTLLASFYKAGHAQLALTLYEAGWRDRGPPLLEPLVQALHDARVRRLGPRVDIKETRLAMAALHQALALDPVLGSEFRRSAGLTGPNAKNPVPSLQWWQATLEQVLGLASAPAPSIQAASGRRGERRGKARARPPQVPKQRRRSVDPT